MAVVVVVVVVPASAADSDDDGTLSFSLVGACSKIYGNGESFTVT